MSASRISGLVVLLALLGCPRDDSDEGPSDAGTPASTHTGTTSIQDRRLLGAPHLGQQVVRREHTSPGHALPLGSHEPSWRTVLLPSPRGRALGRRAPGRGRTGFENLPLLSAGTVNGLRLMTPRAAPPLPRAFPRADGAGVDC